MFVCRGGIKTASSDDYCRISIRSKSYPSKRCDIKPAFDRNGYIPSRDFVRMKKKLVEHEEMLKNREKDLFQERHERNFRNLYQKDDEFEREYLMVS